MDGAPQRRNLSQGLTGQAGAVFLAMESVLDKCFILNYEEHFLRARGIEPLDRTYFAVPQQNPSIQFRMFMDLCNWLITDVTGDARAFAPDKFDDPNTSVNKLMLSLRALDFTLDFAAAKLKLGHGEPVCSVLDFLTDRALAGRRFRFSAPVRRSEADAEEAEVDEAADVGDLSEDLEVAEEEDILFREDGALPGSGAGAGAGAALESSGQEPGEVLHQILEAKVDPVAWRAELERVGPRLKAAGRLARRGGGGDWRAHASSTQTHQRAILRAFPPLGATLSSVTEELKVSLERLRSKEAWVNAHFEELARQFAERKEALLGEERRREGAARRVAGLTSDLAGVSERLEEVRETVEERSSGISDPAPLVKIKASLQDLRAELTTMDLRTGVVAHGLLSAKMRVQKAAQREGTKAKGRTRKGARADASEDDADHYDISDVDA